MLREQLCIGSGERHIPQLTLGWRIQMALAEAGLKHQDLMDKFEVSRATVSKWCRDVGAPPKKFVVNEIAVMCGVPARWLIDGTVDGHDDGPDGPSAQVRAAAPDAGRARQPDAGPFRTDKLSQ